LVSDFDQTLSFNDSGSFWPRCSAFPISGKGRHLSPPDLCSLGRGAHLSCCGTIRISSRAAGRPHRGCRHDPLKRNIALPAEFLKDGIDGFSLTFYVVSAAPWLVVHRRYRDSCHPSHHRRALRLPAMNRRGGSIIQVPAGYARSPRSMRCEFASGVPSDRSCNVGDGSSDIHVSCT